MWICYLYKFNFQIFDIQKFKKHIAAELRQAVINIPRIETMSMVSFSFICNSMPLDVFVAIINFSALDLLGDLQGMFEKMQHDLLYKLCLLSP